MMSLYSIMGYMTGHYMCKVFQALYVSQMILPASTVRFMAILSTIFPVGKKAVASRCSKFLVLPVVARLGLIVHSLS